MDKIQAEYVKLTYSKSTWAFTLLKLASLCTHLFPCMKHYMHCSSTLCDMMQKLIKVGVGLFTKQEFRPNSSLSTFKLLNPFWDEKHETHDEPSVLYWMKWVKSLQFSPRAPYFLVVNESHSKKMIYEFIHRISQLQLVLIETLNFAEEPFNVGLYTGCR